MSVSIPLSSVFAALALSLHAQEAPRGGDEQLAAIDHQEEAEALCDAQNRGELTVAQALRAMASRSHFVGSCAAGIVRHEWEVLPPELFRGLDDSPLAAERFLEELVIAPRPAAAAWVATQTTEKRERSIDHRLLALAARHQPLNKDEAKLVLEAAKKGQFGDGFYFASAIVPPQVADRMIGPIHAGLSQKVLEVGRLGPLLDRLSVRGTRSLLGLAVTLPPEVARSLLRHVYESQPELVQKRVASALDGKIPLDPMWLEFGRKLLTTKERIDRVVAVLVESDDPQARRLAFDLLLSEGALEQRSLAAMRDTGSERDIRRLIGRAVNQLPTSFVIDWLEGSPEVSDEMARALATRRVLEPEIQKKLLEMLDGLGAADSHTPLHAVTALVHGGSAESLKAIWPLVMGSTSWRDLLYRVGQRKEPFTYELMLAEITATDRNDDEEELRQQKLDMLRLLLVARGDRRELDTLVKNAPKRRGIFVRRCRHYADKLTAEQANSLFDAALRHEDPEIGAELLEWAVATQTEEQAQAMIAKRLLSLWTDPPDLEMVEILQDTAMRLLAAGPRRDQLLAELRAASTTGPLPYKLKSLPYELLNTMPQPLSEESVELCAELLLQLPLEDQKGEQKKVRRWPDGTSGFPLVAAIANRLRGVNLGIADQVFEGLVDELVDDPRRANLSRQRLKVFWRTMAFETDLQHLLGRITSRLWRFKAEGDDDAIGEAPAMWFQARHFEHLDDFVKAEQFYRSAGRQLWRLPSTRGEARWLLGERNPGAGKDPLAALAAAPYRMQLLAAKAKGDEDAASKASALLREFAGHDRATLDTLKD